MAIKPIDYNVLLPKTQEVSNMKQVENFKNRNLVHNGFVQQKKFIKNNSKKVIDPNKSENTKININNRSKNQDNSKNNKKNRSKQSKEDENKKTLNKGLGSNVDIRI
jgi:hypothetical protein